MSEKTTSRFAVLYGVLYGVSLWGRTTVSCVRREGREDWEGGQESGGDWGRTTLTIILSSCYLII